MQTARLVLRNFLWNKKVGNAHRKLLAYHSQNCIQTIQTARSVVTQFPIEQKIGRKKNPSTEFCKHLYENDPNAAFLFAYLSKLFLYSNSAITSIISENHIKA